MQGTGVSPGISIGTARIFRKLQNSLSGIRLESSDMIREEAERFDRAVRDSVRELEIMTGNRDRDLNKTEIDILDTQIEFLSDPQIREDVLERIRTGNKTAHDAVIEAIAAFAEILVNTGDEYLKERAADIKDTGNRILKNMDQGQDQDWGELPENSVIIAEDISPSDTISLDLSRISGIATKGGGRTSHTAIIARSRGIPAVVACGDELLTAKNNDQVLIDGSSGEVIIRPDRATLLEFEERQRRFNEQRLLLKRMRDLPAVTTDGKKINLFGNISGAGDLEWIFGSGGEGVGLFRTEMLFMGRNSMPGEEEQFNFYREAAILSGNRPVIIRTLDAGGDKQLPYLGIPHEDNPFLGFRAIRLSLGRREMFMEQIRAILRASAFGNLSIMFPMITSISEVRDAKECVSIAMDSLRKSGIGFNGNIETGIMIEIPAAALMADQLAREVSFFSIGTNDLCQYTLAVDRMNENVSSLYTHFHPSVLRLIHNTIEQAGKHGIHAGLCGEMAADPLATKLLLGMGLEDFSMSADSIPVIKNIIRGTDIQQATRVFETVMQMDDPDAIVRYLKEITL